ncbi:MAG: glycosyltransferase family 2 protein [Candidatus Saccharibacteria bacterium]
MRVAFVIPAYNEATVIPNVLKDLKKALAKTKLDYEIVVVDDGSSDKTGEIVKNEDVFVISHILNSGSGSATATGLSYAQQSGFDIAATLDADGQHDPSEVIKGVELIQKKKTDLLIGSRLINSKGMSKTKVAGNKGLSYITFLLFGIKVTDSQSGMRIYSKKALDNLKWKSSGYEFCSEMLWRAKQQNMKVDEYPITAIYTDYSKAKGQNNWNSFNIIKSLLQRRIMEVFGE